MSPNLHAQLSGAPASPGMRVPGRHEPSHPEEEFLPPVEDSCAATSMGSIEEFSECRSRSRGCCPHHSSFGGIFLCWHPQHQRIVLRTRRGGHFLD
ncbi:MAG: hypothetical protein U1F65_05065 [Verrucomicrobiota bacterium]